MNRVLGCALVLAGTLSSADALAKKNGIEPYMWGIGAGIGTIVVPGHYPLHLPTNINNYNFIDEDQPRGGDENAEEPKRDTDRNGDPRFTSIQPVRDDFRLSAEGFYGIDRDNRIGGTLGTAFGKGYSDVFFLLNYDRVLVSENPFNVTAGIGAGFGSMRFKGVDEEIVGFENELMKVPYFPIRGRLQGQLRNKTTMFALGLFVQTAVPSNTFYTDLDGNEQDATGTESLLNPFYYLSAGVDFTVQFGDFTAPKKPGKGPKNKGGKKGGKGGKAGGGGGKKGGGSKGPGKHP